MPIEDEAVPKVGPGDRLKSERVQQGLSIDDVSESLRLTKDMIELLELNAFDKLPARVFIVGYLRSYSRYLDISETEILDQFYIMCPRGDCEVLPSIVSDVKDELSSSHDIVRLVSWIFGIGFIALLIYWINASDIDLTPIVDVEVTENFFLDDKKTNSILPSLSEVVSTAKQEILFGNGLKKEKMIVDDKSPSVLDAANNKIDVLENVGIDTFVSDVSEKQLLNETVVAVNVVDDIPVVKEKIIPDVVAEQTPANKPKEVTISIKGECWVDIRDSSRKFKLFGKMKAGMMKTLGGKPPYKVVLGDYRQVKLKVDGVVFDIAPFAKGNVARFTFKP